SPFGIPLGGRLRRRIRIVDRLKIGNEKRGTVNGRTCNSILELVISHLSGKGKFFIKELIIISRNYVDRWIRKVRLHEVVLHQSGISICIIRVSGCFKCLHTHIPAHLCPDECVFNGSQIQRYIAQEPIGFVKKLISRSEEHTSELQSRENLVCRLLLEKKKK